CPY
ncbi:cytochrome c551 peroxidase domain protein, partial [Vibrio parahaemolyticus V-223/04]